MKKLLVLVAMLVTFSMLLAVSIDNATARAAAEFHLEINEKISYEIDSEIELPGSTGETVAYIYNLSPQGFIITGVDTDLPVIVGYSFSNNFSTDENSLGYLFVQDDMSNRLAARSITDREILAGNNELWAKYQSEDMSYFSIRDRSVYPPEGYTSTGGWIDLEWDQGYPWNMYCPLDTVNGGRSVTGCVATALSMVLAYHEYVGSVNFSNADDYASSYEGFYCLIDDYSTQNDFPDFPTLNNYLVDVVEHFAGVDPMSDHVKATINFAAGIAVRMKYSSEASGSYVFWSGHHDSREALLNKFGYDSADGFNGSNPQMYDQLEEDMMNGRPAMFGILGGVEGHAIVCDGWNEGENSYHLNFGWDGYNNGWYTLPAGMPGGYNTIDNAVANIEGGGTLFNLFSLFTTSTGVTPEYAEIEFLGNRLYEGNLDEGGAFVYDFMHEGTYQVTVTYENPDGGYYYKAQSFDLNESNDFLMMELDDYTTLTGNVSGISDPSGVIITYYDETGEIVAEGTTDGSGNYSLAGLLPGTYLATASWGETYFAEQEVEITATQQNFDFSLEEYPETGNISYYDGIGDVYHLIATTMSCAIKLTPEDLSTYLETAFNKVEFKAPIAPADGQLWAQVWAGTNLVSEKAIDSFSYGEMVEVTLDNFVAIEEGMDYYVGYKIQSGNGDVGWFDTTPRVAGKGAWFHINSWTEVNATFDHNFIITAKVISMESDGEEMEVIPIATQLSQNYPNPFNPETSIAFTLAETGQANLEVYNIKGQKIKTLANGIYDKGEHILSWNGLDDSGKPVSSGIYFYKLKNGRYTSTKKMILMK